MAQSKSSKRWSAGRFTPIALWISGLGLFSAVIVLIIKLLNYIGLYAITNQKLFTTWLLISVGVAILGPAVYTLLDPKKARDLLTGRQARHGSNAVIMLVAFILILIVINVIVYQNPMQWDWTESKQNSLAPETVNALKALPAHVHAIGFYTSNLSKAEAQTLLDNVKSKSNGKFTFEFIDPNSDPVKAEQYKITQDGTIVLTMSGHQELFTTITEQNFTNSLVHLMNPGERTVYFLTGHGEHNSETAGQKSYTRARAVLESKNYTVKTLNLLAQNKVPDDALAIIIAGPTQPITSEELTLLTDYLSKGGSLVVLDDPNLTPSTTSTPDPLIDYLAASWDIKLDNDLVIDPSSTQPIVTWAFSYGLHPITNNLNTQNVLPFFPTTRSLTLESTNQEVQTTSLVKTVSGAWGETDLSALQNKQVSFDASTDFAGPLTIAAAAEKPSGKGKVVVIGDSDFASDAYFDQYGNTDMFINSIDWAAGQESMISLTTKQAVTREMRPLTNTTVLLLAFAFIILVPGLILAGGIGSWLVRRSRG